MATPHLNNLSSTALGELATVTTSVADIEYIELGFIERLNGHPELRRSLFQIARQNAEIRRAAAADEVLPTVKLLELDSLLLPTLATLLSTTHDTAIVARIEELTIYRLSKLPEIRRALFDIAKEGVTLRAMAAAA